jgi:hypothetical protein
MARSTVGEVPWEDDRKTGPLRLEMRTAAARDGMWDIPDVRKIHLTVTVSFVGSLKVATSDMGLLIYCAAALDFALIKLQDNWNRSRVKRGSISIFWMGMRLRSRLD